MANARYSATVLVHPTKVEKVLLDWRSGGDFMLACFAVDELEIVLAALKEDIETARCTADKRDAQARYERVFDLVEVRKLAEHEL
ncbi:MAG: hypothetical protein H6922_01950 [Pseudomonadaceae bacterium]|nr:hypothetical protein [Pseudomonadaceae bacterium]